MNSFQQTDLVQEALSDRTEVYLKALIADVSGTLDPDFDARAPFGELGIDSFQVLKILRKLEADFGALPKTLLFEKFHVSDLAEYFVDKHGKTLESIFAGNPELSLALPEGEAGREQAAGLRPYREASTNGHKPTQRTNQPIRILEREAFTHPETQDLVQGLFQRYKSEGCVSRGTRKIAPNLFISSSRKGYFNYGRNRNLIIVYGYTGPRYYLPELVEEIFRYCETRNFQLNILSDEEVNSIGERTFSATPFGVMQRIGNLAKFTLEGGDMRRLRYQVTKFQKNGVCQTSEYKCGTDPQTDQNIALLIDQWCAARTLVNPLVHEVREEIVAGTLPQEHRLFLTSLDGVPQNVILITQMSSGPEDDLRDGYLMDLEFYPPSMPLGGLEFGIVEMIHILQAEGCSVLSLGGTYGCKLGPSSNADPEIDTILDDLRIQGIFDDSGNLQFKNKFRPDNKSIYLCRPWGSGDPNSVIDVIMMIADPDKMQTSEEDNFTLRVGGVSAALSPPPQTSTQTKVAVQTSPSVKKPELAAVTDIANTGRERILSDAGFNPLNLSREHIAFDLKTDSWAQLSMPAIEDQMRRLHGQMQRPVDEEEVLRAAFRFPYFVITRSGQAAERTFFCAFSRKGLVLQNLLFPSTIFHLVNEGFTPVEIPVWEVFDLTSKEPYNGNLDLHKMKERLAKDSDQVALVVIEVCNNASGGCPVSLAHLRELKELLRGYSIPLVIDGTRVLENAQLLIERETECAAKSVWTVAQEILSYADILIGSLTKDFCVSEGGIIATHDLGLLHRMQQIVEQEGLGVDRIDQKMIALTLLNRKQIDSGIILRMQKVRLVWKLLSERGIPVAASPGGHCVLVDPKQIPQFAAFAHPAASFVAWLFLNTGIRAGVHNAGLQKHSALNELVRLAIPVGLTNIEAESLTQHFISAFAEMVNIPEIAPESRTLDEAGVLSLRYKLVRYHNLSRPQPAAASVQVPSKISSPAGPIQLSSKPDLEASASAGGRGAARSSGPAQREPIAIIGMAGRYPDARDLEKLWQNLVLGTDSIREMPQDRYERRLELGYTERYRGGFIEDVDRFDSLFFNISPREAEMLDPQERLFLETAWEVLEDAGYYPETIATEGSPRNIGVYVGAVWAMYQMLGIEEKHAGGAMAPGSFLWSIANRVSYSLNLSGPSLTVDTACSSSLTALYLACEAIHSGDCSAAIVGGVNLDLHQAKLDINRNGGALSPDGVCRSFGKGANGYVAGEGVGALMLKPLSQAMEDGDNIHGLIRSAVVNHGGRTSGYTVPNPKAQTDVIVAAMERGGIDARSIGYIEAHGTGTELGDPIEIAGLTEAFRHADAGPQTCAIGSIKSNIGHLEAAAGVVGITKVLLQMKHRTLVPSLHSSELNEFIDFSKPPFYVIQKTEIWRNKEVDGVTLPLRAGISSFGAGGSNAHILLESYEPAMQTRTGAVPDERKPDSLLIVPLSARSEEQLRTAATRLTQFLERNRVDIVDLAHTLQQGRKSFDHRLAILATTQEELAERLSMFLEGKFSGEIVSGNGKASDNFLRLLSSSEKRDFFSLLAQKQEPHKLAGLWVEGMLTDWRGFSLSQGGRKISLPTYPFADRRHWLGNGSRTPIALQRAAALHPLLDSNESTFERQLFKKTFDERDFFIYDHHVAEVATLPGVAYLELARKAGEAATGRPVRRIKNILWVSPIVVERGKSTEAWIELKPAGDSVQFEVFSDAVGKKQVHSQGKLMFAAAGDAEVSPEYIDLDAIRSRCSGTIEASTVYPLFRSIGLDLGPSFQVLDKVYKNGGEALGVLKLPNFRHADLEAMVLHPSLIDGSLQAGMAAQLGESVDEMLVPYSIGEVEILAPLQTECFSYAVEAKELNKVSGQKSRVLKSNVTIVDPKGRILVRILENTGVPLRDVQKKPEQLADADGFSNLTFAYGWEPAPLDEVKQPVAARSLLLFAGNDTDQNLSQQFLERFSDQGVSVASVLLVRPGMGFEDLGADTFTLNPANKQDFVRLFTTVAERGFAITDICFAWKPEHSSFNVALYPFLFLCQAVIEQKIESQLQLLYCFVGNEELLQQEDWATRQPYGEAVAGFIATLRMEHPKLLAKLVELRQASSRDEEMVHAVTAECLARMQDGTAIRYDGKNRSIRKLKLFELDQTPAASSDLGAELKQHGVYLITGGVGGLGLIFADYLARKHSAKLVLAGRSPLSDSIQTKLDALSEAGAEVLYLAADVSSLNDVKALIKEGKHRFGRIDGVIHAAGVTRDSYIRNKTKEEMSEVLAPKVYGSIYLDEATREEDLNFFVMFSSLAATTGNIGQSDYAFANRFMDAFSEQRERLRTVGERRGKTLSINWSLWEDGGMKPDEQTIRYFRNTLGIRPLSTTVGLTAFVGGLRSQRPQFAVVEGIREKLEASWGTKKRSDSANVAAPAAAAAGSSGVKPVNDLATLVEGDLSRMVMDFLKIDQADMATDKVLLDLGFDSIGLTTFSNAINEKYELDLTPVLFFDYPSVSEIAKYLAIERAAEMERHYRKAIFVEGQEISGPPEISDALKVDATDSHKPIVKVTQGWDAPHAASSSNHGRSAAPASEKEPIAIVGISGVMPQSEDLEAFWQNLKSAKDMVTVIPKDRWDWEDYYGDPFKEQNKSNSKWGGFMDEVDKFDPLFFGISPREAQMMDPQQRIFLETVWKAVEDSGQKVSDLSGTRTGLFVGAATNDYSSLISRKQTVLDAYSASGNSHSVLANRVSFLLNLRGPSAPIDTACSSSLIALHRAIESIYAGNSDMAIVGGVQVILSPAAYISFGMAGMLSGDGKCKTFDKRANGYVRGEGSGAVFLKRLSAAEADGNHIYALVTASAENHGGRVSTMTAPNSSAQTALLIEAYEKANIDPATVGYIECHGTGTSLGDPIEIQSLSKAFTELYKRRNQTPPQKPHCGLSSVKTNIGHLETAAGIAGVLKVVLALEHKQIPANVHFEELNPFIHLEGTPFFIADKLTEWPQPIGEDGAQAARRAGVSSFGFGGANAHVVLEEYLPGPRELDQQAPGPQLIVLSARTRERLDEYARSMEAWMQTADGDLADFAWTLQAGRNEMTERMAFVASSWEDVRHGFEQSLRDDEPSAKLYRGSAPAKSPAPDSIIDNLETSIETNDLENLAKLWVSGAKIDWRLLRRRRTPMRLSIPTYPFARDRYWIPESAVSESGEAGGTIRALMGEARLHPLLHRNTSTLKEQKFSSRFSGKEFFFAEHSMQTGLGRVPVLPAAAYLEMALAAGGLSGEQSVFSLENVVWSKPLAIMNDPVEVEIGLLPLDSGADFVVRSLNPDDGHAITHCRGMLAYAAKVQTPPRRDVERYPEEVIAAQEFYSFLRTSGLVHGGRFQIVEMVYCRGSEYLAVLKTPIEESGDYQAHPAILDAAVHAAIGLAKWHEPASPWPVPYSVEAVEFFHSLEGVAYAHGSWTADKSTDGKPFTRMQLELLGIDGRVLARMKNFVVKPVQAADFLGDSPEYIASGNHNKIESGLEGFRPVWNPVTFGKEQQASTPTKILLLGDDRAGWEWLLQFFPTASYLDLSAVNQTEGIAEGLSGHAFEELVWIAPDVPSAALPQLHEDGIITRQVDGTLAVFRIIKALLQLGYANKKLSWTLVIGPTQQVTEVDLIQPAHAGIVGLIGSLAKEYPLWDLKLLDVDSLEKVSARDCLLLPPNKQGDVLAHRGGTWFAAELMPCEAVPRSASLYRQDGVYVVLGGAGGLGEVWTRRMIEDFQAKVVWIGRRKYDQEIEDKINRLTRNGSAPLYISADATDRNELQLACERILKIYPTIHGVVHAAGVLQDRTLANMNEAQFRSAFSAKVDVCVNTTEVFGPHVSDFMIFFSSIISFFKTPGQSNYAAGSTFQDSFATSLSRQSGYTVKIINWGYWGSVGVVADDFHRKMMKQVGLGSIEPEPGMAALRDLVDSDLPQLAVVQRWHEETSPADNHSDAKTREHGVGRNGASVPSWNGTSSNGNHHNLEVQSIAEGAVQMDVAVIRQAVLEQLRDALRMEIAAIRTNAPFADYGVDSIIGVSLVRSINEALHIELEATTLFEFSTVDRLAAHIAERWGSLVGATPDRVPAPTLPTSALGTPQMPAYGDHTPALHALNGNHRFAGQVRPTGDNGRAVLPSDGGDNSRREDPIAIIGMSGRFANSESLEDFWRNLKEGRDLVGEVSRWEKRACASQPDGQAFCSQGSYLESAAEFDPDFFGLSAAEATYMDPQQRLFLEESWRALEDAGYAGPSAQEKKCGVYVGAGNSNYDRLFADVAPAHAWWGNAQSIAPARIAYHLNLQGPAIAVDAACSSSMVAIHLACQALWSRETEMALAGGVYVQATPAFHQVANRAGMLSTDGKCYSFDARANGFVPGEAVGVVVLKRLRDALQDGDHIHAVIAGSGINQNGSSNGILSPNVKAQEQLMRGVYDRFEINPQSIQVVEAHGTGTLLGDALEHLAISRVFNRYGEQKQFCAIGSVKTNIGHAGNAAGIASLLKLLLSLKHKEIPPSLHFEKANPAIDFEASPFYINTQPKHWATRPGQLRRGAVSSFGFSGTNAHIVVEEAPATQQPVVHSPGYLAVVSARSSEQLRQQAGNLLALVKMVPGLSMNDLSFTLFTGRTHFSHRLSCMVRNQAELESSLTQWLETGEANGINAGEIPQGKLNEQISLKKFGNYCIQECRNTCEAGVYHENLAALGELYVQGYTLDFQSLFSSASHKMALPVYPFVRGHYWVSENGDHAAAKAASMATGPSDKRKIASDMVTVKPHWTFSPGGPGAASSLPVAIAKLSNFGRLELFLKQEVGLQLGRAVDDIAVDQSYIDLGMSSLGLSELIRKANQLLEEDLSPSVLFEFNDIQSLAAYLATNYPAKVEAIAVKAADKSSVPSQYASVAGPETVPDQTGSEMHPKKEWFGDLLLDDSYERVTF